MQITRMVAIALLGCCTSGFAGHAGAQARIGLERFEGPFMSATGSTLNEGSTLQREWFVLNDESGPVRIDGKTGIEVVFDPWRGRFTYRASYTLKAIEPIVAWEIRYVVVDVFGRIVRTYGSTRVTDVSSNFARESVSWVVCGLSEASRAYSSVAYVASARLASGKVYEIDRAAAASQIRTVADKVTDALLEPERPLLLISNCLD